MRVALNCLHIIPGKLGGLETYMSNLMDDLYEAGSNTEFLIFCGADFKGYFEKWSDKFQIIPIDIDVTSTVKRILFEQFGLSKWVKKHKIDVLHSSGYSAPITCDCRTVQTVHDLNYLEIPDTVLKSHGFLRGGVLRILGPLSMRQSDRVIALTNYGATRIAELCGISTSKIDVVYNRSPLDFSEIDGEECSLPRAFSDGYMLYVASWFPHKNHETLFQALALAKRNHRKCYPLVLAGLHLKDSAKRAELEENLRMLNIRQHVHVIEDRLSLDALALLYRRARLFVFPSLYEGFGIPILEAMSANIPVLGADLPVVTEIGGDGIMTFNPKDAEELLEKVELLHEDQDLSQSLARNGRARYLALRESSRERGNRMVAIYTSALRS